MNTSVNTAIDVVAGSCDHHRERCEHGEGNRDRGAARSRDAARSAAHCAAHGASEPNSPCGLIESTITSATKNTSGAHVGDHQTATTSLIDEQQHRRCHRAADAAHPAEDHDRQQARDQVVAAVGVERVGRAEHHAADRGDRDSDPDRDRPHAVDVDPDQVGGGPVLQRGANRAPELGPVEHLVQRRPSAATASAKPIR